MKLRLLPQMMLYILLPVLLGLCLVVTLNYQTAQKAMNNQIHEELQLLASGRASELENIIVMMQGTTSTLADVARIRDLLIKADSGNTVDPKLLVNAKTALTDLVENYERVNMAGIIDAHGIMIVSTNPELVGADRKSAGYFTQAMRNKTAMASVLDKTSGKMQTLFAESLTDASGTPLGIVYVSLDMEALSKSTTNTVKVANTGIAYLYDNTGVMMMHPKQEYVGINYSGDAWVRDLLKLKTGLLEYQWDGVDKIAALQEIKGTGWVMVVAVDKQDIFAPISNMLQQSLFTMLAVLIIACMIIVLFARNLAQTLKRGADITQYVAAGNFTLDKVQEASLQKSAKRSDEIGTLSQGILGMIANLKQFFNDAEKKTREAVAATEEAHKATVRAELAQKAAESAKREGMLAAADQLESVVSIVSSASSELSSQIEQSERGSSEQAARVTETATAMEEMNSTVIEVARNASNAAEVSAKTRDKAEHGARILQEALGSIQQVQVDSLTLKNDMQELGQQANEISKIMNVISDIADQTNLLALNAAIEAARAGDAGRGFAVVADEVRKLAEKTMTSTVDVGNAIRAIQSSSEKSTQQVDRTVLNIEKATEQALNSGKALHEIVDMVDSTADQVRAIATASEEQSASSEEINNSIVQVNTIAAETARAMQEAAQAVSELAEQAHVLETLIENMKQG